jgi:hypothetical protein
MILPLSFASHLRVGGIDQIHPDADAKSHVGLGRGYKSMTYGVMNLMSGMTNQIATIIRSGKASSSMMNRSADILAHIAEMMNYAPAYMSGTKVMDYEMVIEMQNMLKDIDKMRKELDK